MRALDGERRARREARRGDPRALRRAAWSRTGFGNCWRARGASCANASPRPSLTARTASPTRSIRTATATARSASASRLTRERGGKGEDRFIFDASETDDKSPGPVNFLMNPGVPGMALGLYYLGGDPGQVCNAGGPQALDEVSLARRARFLRRGFPRRSACAASP